MTLVRNAGTAAGAHRNLVELLGYCTQPQALIYEWVGGGDLKSILGDPGRLAGFTLYQRVLCFRGMARGL